MSDLTDYLADKIIYPYDVSVSCREYGNAPFIFFRVDNLPVRFPDSDYFPYGHYLHLHLFRPDGRLWVVLASEDDRLDGFIEHFFPLSDLTNTGGGGVTENEWYVWAVFQQPYPVESGVQTYSCNEPIKLAYSFCNTDNWDLDKCTTLILS